MQGFSFMLGENVVASGERARRSPNEMTPRRRGVILKSGGRFGGGVSPRNDVRIHKASRLGLWSVRAAAV
jgi:hypothetical protein